MQINWDSFINYNQDARGVRLKFEDLCRQLFINENLTRNKQFRYPHANPNNHGLETEPIFDEMRNQWIGFQAKFFDNDVDYNQIKSSAEKIVEYYTGKEGTVNLVYLFCNKPITSTSKGFLNTADLLRKNNIELQLITDNAILDLVRNKYPYLGLYYFGNYALSQQWFQTQANKMFDELGERFNQNFNVETDFSTELSLFVHDKKAADFLNAKKNTLLKKAEELYKKNRDGQNYLTALMESVSALPDVSTETLCESFKWNDLVIAEIESFLDKLREEKDSQIKKLDKLYKISCDCTKLNAEREGAEKDYQDTKKLINKIETMMELPSIISVSDEEKCLLCSNMMVLSGRAGSGKSQLLANKAKCLLEMHRAVLLLLAGIYYSDRPIHEQIISNLHLECSFEELIDILETIGERDNCIVPIFIDALNETWHNILWKTGLPTILEKIKNAPMVKLVVSYRPEYESILLSDAVQNKIQEKTIAVIHHVGFGVNSGFAIRQFLNHYNIPFSPLEYFSAEMTNPLFLTLYCKTYNGEEVSLPSLYERLIEKANSNIFYALNLRSQGYCDNDDILSPLVSQIANCIVKGGRRVITKEELTHLDFWGEHGIAVVPFVNQLIKEEILHCHANEDAEYYYFAYDQMNDYYCAKAIITNHKEKASLRNYLSEHILEIKDGNLGNFSQIDLFVNVCALFAEKFGEECIDIIDELKDEYEQWEVFSRYINSFQWREPNFISKESFCKLVRKYHSERHDIWSMLISNSVKVGHPFNADFLHKILSSCKLNIRDYIWTTYINGLPSDNDNRLVQLIQMYNRGEKLDITNEKQIELLLTLFGWLLTSSNRWLRDHTSKAMIEILKEHFQLCVPILERFKDVDDPYVLQRLFGIVFGACCKRNGGDFQKLAEYVYEIVFNQEKVYPDILLRDYARLIIEKFLSETSGYKGSIIHEKIIPPYNSDPIPEIEDQHYLDRKYDGAMFKLISSMRFEKMGMYGDFGRYVFQYALKNFEIDEYKMFNYAVYHILNELGFNAKYFGEYDRYCGNYDRHETIKTERIGKKYQWITMYNMLARISDHCKMKDSWNWPPKDDVQFEGAWNPYVRDFDPTLNLNSIACDDTPVFDALKNHATRGSNENKEVSLSDPKAKKDWMETAGIFLDTLKGTLILTDNNGQQWVCLTKYCDTGHKDLNTKQFLAWSWVYAYFMTPEQANDFTKCAEKGLSVITNDTASHHQTYAVFNREYPWSPSCREFEEHAWVEARIKTGDIETITETIHIPNLKPIETHLQKYWGFTDDDEELAENVELLNGKDVAKDDVADFDTSEICFKEETRYRQVEAEKEIGKILHATTDLVWEEEYDATKEEAISYHVPCAKLIEDMNLSQIVADGFFYDSEGKLAAFDTNLTQKINSVVVRKDILDGFLAKNGMKLVWLVKAEKEIHAKDYLIADWSEWEAVFSYEDDRVEGKIRKIPKRTG